MKKGSHLVQLKLDELKRNQIKLSDALDRFESGNLKHLKNDAKLTILNLSIEAQLSKSTAFSKYKEGHKLSGEYRFPEIVRRFREIRNAKLKFKKNNDREKIKQLRANIKEFKRKLSASRNVVNSQDILIIELEKKVQTLEANEIRIINRINELEENANLKRNSISVIKRN